ATKPQGATTAMPTPNVYENLGIRRVVNAATTLTALGGTVLAPEVVDAMTAASTSCVSMEELHLEAALVTSGCATAIVLAVLASVTNGRPELIAQMHHDTTLARNVVMHRSH